jgi:hypothetical protein
MDITWIKYCLGCDKILSQQEIEQVYSEEIDHIVAEKCIYCGKIPALLETLVKNNYFADPEVVLKEVE